VATERTITRKVLSALKETDWTFGVEGVSTTYSQDVTQVTKDVFEVGEAIVRCRRGEDRSWLLLIPGNGEDIVSDYGMNLDVVVSAALDELDL